MCSLALHHFYNFIDLLIIFEFIDSYIMEYSYLYSYKNKRIDYNKLHRKILDKFKGSG